MMTLSESAIEHIISLLSQTGEPLYALVDAAREPLVRQWLLTEEMTHRSLYSGQAAVELEHFAPYLVQLNSAFQVRAFINAAWGKSWGVLLISAATFDELRRHFRKFLMVKLDDGGIEQEVYFRFYDPRVLRSFLPTCTDTEWIEFFGPVAEFVTESEDPMTALRFSAERASEVESVVL